MQNGFIVSICLKKKRVCFLKNKEDNECWLVWRGIYFVNSKLFSKCTVCLHKSFRRSRLLRLAVWLELHSFFVQKKFDFSLCQSSEFVFGVNQIASH